MMRSLVGFGFLLLLQVQCCLPCAVSRDQRSQVDRLLHEMIQAATAPGALPNPSVLLALRLSRNHNQSAEQTLLRKLRQDAIDRVKNGRDFSSGLVALYALAFRASCSDPRKVSANLDLVNLLEKKYKKEVENIDKNKYPLTTYYQLSLCILTLCQLHGDFSAAEVAKLLTRDEKIYSLGGQFNVDTAAVATLALVCVQTVDKAELSPEDNQTIASTVEWLLKKILEEKRVDGIIGNIYSTGLAMQALTVSRNYSTSASWNCSQTLDTVLSEVEKGSFDNPMAAAQIVPSLEGRTYLDVKRMYCSKGEENPILSATQSPIHHSPIDVTYTVVDGVNSSFSDSIKLSVPSGSVFIKVMEAAQNKDNGKFRYLHRGQGQPLSG
ncbi:transcobalamin-1-like isoform X2 [Varanus komodoensis]|uniref:transcobalamin-1-like isoform X2 n=1 Tax=Varanus komodoensis TaxID=61221 RepID=UPI001CF7B85E|nr:transcobalamin-1-like isoform X2 [Varanus komodoensis]